MDILAETSNATRRFGAVTVVSAADLAVAGGEVVGLLGANGAGKTALIRLLLGLLRPTDGTARVFGSAPSIATRRRVGYLPQALGLYAGLAVTANWKFAAAAFRNTSAPLPEGISAWLSRTGIDATIETVPANLEEAFVAIAANPEPS